MTHSLRAAAAVALISTAFGAFSASSVQGADEFHCSVSPCKYTVKPDGSQQTAHQVFLIENADKTQVVSITCAGLTGEAEVVGNTANSLTMSGVNYENCVVNGGLPGEWDTNGCEYKLTAGSLALIDRAETHFFCPGPEQAEFTTVVFATSCIFKVGSHTTAGVGYHSVGSSPNREITATTIGTSMVVTANSACTNLLNIHQNLSITKTTGHYLLRGESSGGVKADAWFQ